MRQNSDDDSTVKEVKQTEEFAAAVKMKLMTQFCMKELKTMAKLKLGKLTLMETRWLQCLTAAHQ